MWTTNMTNGTHNTYKCLFVCFVLFCLFFVFLLFCFSSVQYIGPTPRRKINFKNRINNRCTDESGASDGHHRLWCVTKNVPKHENTLTNCDQTDRVVILNNIDITAVSARTRHLLRYPFTVSNLSFKNYKYNLTDCIMIGQWGTETISLFCHWSTDW